MSLRRVSVSSIRPGDEIELHVRRRGMTTIQRMVVEGRQAGMLVAVGGGMLDPEAEGEWYVRSSTVDDIIVLAETLAEITEVSAVMEDPRSSEETRDACRRRLESMSNTVRGILATAGERN